MVKVLNPESKSFLSCLAVDHVEISICINNCIFRFEISVYNGTFMEIFYGDHETSEVELCWYAVYSYLWEEIEEISPFNVAEQKID